MLFWIVTVFWLVIFILWRSFRTYARNRIRDDYNIDNYLRPWSSTLVSSGSLGDDELTEVICLSLTYYIATVLFCLAVPVGPLFLVFKIPLLLQLYGQIFSASALMTICISVLIAYIFVFWIYGPAVWVYIMDRARNVSAAPSGPPPASSAESV